jgi:hypothetical protein
MAYWKLIFGKPMLLNKAGHVIAVLREEQKFCWVDLPRNTVWFPVKGSVTDMQNKIQHLIEAYFGKPLSEICKE